MIIADTNVIAYLLIDGPFTRKAESVLGRDPDWAAPPLWRSEFANVLSIYVRKRTVGVEAAIGHFRRAASVIGPRELPVDHIAVLRLADASGCSPYDCEFVWAAQQTGAPLVTADRKVLAAFPGVAVSLEAFAEN